MATLVIREGDGAGGEHPLDGELILGREPGASGLLLEDPGVSRRHAAVRDRDGAITVEDLGSSNGTFVNGERISGEVELADGDEIRLGGTVVSVQGADAATALLGGAAPPTAAHPGPAAPPPPARPSARRGQPEVAPSRLGRGPNEGGDNIPALAAIFLGPLSIVLVAFTSGGAFYLALPCAIAAVILGSIGMRNVDRGRTDRHRSLAHIGRITGIIGTILSVIALIAVVVVAAALDAGEDSLSDVVDRIREEIEGVDVPDAPDVDAPDAPELPEAPSDGGGVESP